MSTVVLLIHEHELARRFVTHVLEQQGGYIVIAAGDSDEALHFLHQQEPAVVPDVLVLGSRQHAAVLVSPLRRHLPDSRRLPALVLDELPGVAIAPSVHRVSTEPRELLLKLKAVLKPGPSELTPLELEGLRLDPGQQQAWVGHLPLNLTSLAFRLLYFLMAHPGRVYTRAQLLETVWADQGFVEERTVDVHVYRLRNQLARYGSGHLIEAVRGSGYRFANEAPRKRGSGAEGIRFAS
ncbi:MAG: winged helix-turn-helix domain-containing protein [bacterium]|nr:winged helix-turn-helix domain-containing protein [bacterium]